MTIHSIQYIKRQFLYLCIFVLQATSVANAQETTTSSESFHQAEAFENLPGGITSHTKALDRNAFSQPSANLSVKQLMDFTVGKGFFKRLWVSAPSSTQAADGLGPLYNARSCLRCHVNNGRGHAPLAMGDNAVSMLLRLSIPPQTPAQQTRLNEKTLNVIPEPTYGVQLQDTAIQGLKAEGRIQVLYQEIKVKLADGKSVFLRKPNYSINNLGYGPLHKDTQLSPRIASPMIGLGLLAAIDEKDILSHADPKDKDGDGISGKANRVWSKQHDKLMLGRFGWKASSPTLSEQTQSAFFNDLGISVPLHPNGAGECTQQQVDCLNAPNGNSPQYRNLEAHKLITDIVTFYSSNLSVPARHNYNDKNVLAGKKLFYQSGCISCHVPKFVTGTLNNHPELSNQLIWPYSDMLLHDMGEGLADHRPEGLANGREWRTPPLWGIGLTPIVSNDRYGYLHDGRARTLLEAILWHGGEAETSRNKVIKMTQQERDNLLNFVRSL